MVYLKAIGAAALVLTLSTTLRAQQPPSVSQVLMYSGISPSGSVPAIYTETVQPTSLTDSSFGKVVTTPSNYSIASSLVSINNALNASIATALSIIPLSSPASGVIVRTDPATGAELPVSSTLGPIFTERAETIGRHRVYVGFSHQDYHFTKFNGASLNSLSVLYGGGFASAITPGSGANANQPISTVPATFNLGMDVRLSQDIAFITYGATDRLDVSLGLPMIHAAVASRTYNGVIYAGTGFGNPTCWCADTFTPGSPTLIQSQIGQASMSKTGFGDLLIRAKGTVVRKPGAVVAVGADLRLPTGDEANYLGTGATSVKPFAAVSLYSKPFSNGIVISPHVDAGWQFTGKSILGGQLNGTQNGNTLTTPFTASKDYLPDVFSWAAGTEVALGRHNTIVADILGNQIGWINGIPNAVTSSISGVSLPTGPNGDSTNTITPVKGTATGLISAGRVSYGQYSGSFGYKARVLGNLVVNFNMVVRFDNNGLTARLVPLYGLGYSF